MEIDGEGLKDLMRSWFAQLRKVEAELLAYVSVVEVFAQSDPTFDMKKLLETARKTPLIQETLSKKYDQFEREVLESIDKGVQGQALAKFLQNWTPPSGSVH